MMGGYRILDRGDGHWAVFRLLVFYQQATPWYDSLEKAQRHLARIKANADPSTPRRVRRRTRAEEAHKARRSKQKERK